MSEEEDGMHEDEQGFTDEELQQELMKALGPEDLEQLKGLFDAGPEGLKDISEDEFLSMLFIGECPACERNDTILCDEVEGIDDPTVALCKDCGFMWCTECGTQIEAGRDCGHWDICEKCKEPRDEFEDCGIPVCECPHILDWLGEIAAGVYGSTCAWCGGDIPEGEEVFAIGAKLKEGIDFHTSGAADGYFMLVVLGGRKVPVIVTGQNSEARRQGNDWMFMTCSEECATELKVALEIERDTIEKAELN